MGGHIMPCTRCQIYITLHEIYCGMFYYIPFAAVVVLLFINDKRRNFPCMAPNAINQTNNKIHGITTQNQIPPQKKKSKVDGKKCKYPKTDDK